MNATEVAGRPGRVELVIEGGPRPRLGQAMRELWAYRRTVLAFAERDVRVKYKQTILGVLWAVLQPPAFIVIFIVVSGRWVGVPGVRGVRFQADLPHVSCAVNYLARETRT